MKTRFIPQMLPILCISKKHLAHLELIIRLNNLREASAQHWCLHPSQRGLRAWSHSRPLPAIKRQNEASTALKTKLGNTLIELVFAAIGLGQDGFLPQGLKMAEKVNRADPRRRALVISLVCFYQLL